MPAACCDLMYASPKELPVPITSPVDFISGPRIGSLSGNLLNGKTGPLTAKNSCDDSDLTLCSLSDIPIIVFAAIFASCLPVALDTKGTVLAALGLTSRINILPF